MKLIRQGFETLTMIDSERVMRSIEQHARVCYKSEDKIGDGTADPLVRKVVANGHHSVLEHESFSVRFITDRGVTHEMVRHRLCAFSQESTRYCNYGKAGEVTFVIPSWFGAEFPEVVRTPQETLWTRAMGEAEFGYLSMLRAGASPQEARTVLPNSLKTEIDVTANLREWRHILTLRTSKAAHPQMRSLMLPLLRFLQGFLPVVFSDIGEA